MSCNPSTVNSSVLPSDLFYTLSSLLPGLLVNAVIKQITSTGLIVNYLGSFEGVVNVRHLTNHEFSLEKFTINKKLRAKLLWVDVLNKRTGLSLQRELVTGVGYQFKGMELGNIFHSAKIVYVESRNGVMLSLPNGAFGFSHLQLMYDEKSDRVLKQHCLGSCHSCRVIQFNLLDGLAIVSLQNSVLEQPFMVISDVKPGSIVEGEISKVTAKGFYLQLSKHIDGFCPVHEIDSKFSRKKFVKGATVKCRVILVDVSNNFILLSSKKGLTKSELPFLTDFDTVNPGDVYDGEIAAVKDTGLLVRFCSKICGFVPLNELCSTSTQVIMDPKASFKVGEVVRCRVLEVDAENQKLKLSLRKEAGSVDISAEDEVKPGDILDLEVTGVANNGISLRNQSTGELVFLPLESLSDYPSHSKQLLSIYGHLLSSAVENGKPYFLKRVLILNGRSSTAPAMATLKKLLVQAVNDDIYPASFSEQKVLMLHIIYH